MRSRRVKTTTGLCVWIMLCALGWAAAPCSSKIRGLRIDRAEYRQLQQGVNQGHQPWRLDSKAVAGRVILDLTYGKNRTSVYEVPLVEVNKTRTRAIYLYRLNGSSYYITLEKFDWLLPVAKRWEWMVWVPAHSTLVTCGEGESESR